MKTELTPNVMIQSLFYLIRWPKTEFILSTVNFIAKLFAITLIGSCIFIKNYSNSKFTVNC